MGVALGVLFLWLGGACLWVATHGTQASSPWGIYEEVLGGIRKGGGTPESGGGSNTT